MKVTFFSNYLNHHQLPFCLAMRGLLGDDFLFVASAPFNKERLKVGYEDMNHKYDFVIRCYENEEQYRKAYSLAMESDVIILGSAPDEFVYDRLKNNGNAVTFRYSERLFKETAGKVNYFSPYFYWNYLIYFLRRKKNYFLLSASAYAPSDYVKIGFGRNKYFKWGYFPSIDSWYNSTEKNKGQKIKILWVGRFIDWKHPEHAVEVARRLVHDNIDFEMKLVGDGPIREDILALIKDYNLEKYVSCPGGLSSQQTREEMKISHIFLFTSDWNEGWGAVMNESMGSGCAVVASHAVGSVPYLIKENENGLVYTNGDVEELYSKVKFLVDNPDIAKKYGDAAYHTITEIWNAEVAADRFVKLAQTALDGNINFDLFAEGPCSKARLIREDWK